MDEDERRDDEQVTNDENDAREEDIVEDTDSDTQDVDETVESGDSEILRRISALEESITRIAGGIDALREAQSIMVENGATIIDESEPEEMNLNVDSFVSPSELDLII